MKVTTFHITYRETGERFKWAFWRDPRKPAHWMLRDHEGYVRTLEPTWADSVPRIRLIADNYGCDCNIS